MNWLRQLLASVFHRHGRCRGVVLWRWAQTQVELWWVPAEERVTAHTHPRIDSTLRLWSLDADIGVRRPGQEWRCEMGGFCGRAFHIGPADAHWLQAWRPTVILNVQRWADSPTSAAVDWVDA